MNLQKEQLKITISLGLIAFFTTLIFGISQIQLEKSFIFELVKYIVYSFFIVSLVSLFLFIIFTGTKLKSRDIGVIDELLPVGERFRNFLYDEGIDMTFRGIIYSIIFLSVSKLTQIINLSSKIFNFLFAGVLAIILFTLIYYIIYKIIRD